MLGGGFRIRAATATELSEVLETLAEASRWEVSRGFPHPWPVPFPEDRVQPGLDRGEVYRVSDPAGRPAGTVTLQWEDLLFWGPRPADAGYVHRLAVRRAYAGRGLGSRILAWADGEVRAWHREFVRLDCLTSATRLHELYRSNGFRPVGEVTVGGLDCTLFEKRLPPR